MNKKAKCLAIFQLTLLAAAMVSVRLYAVNQTDCKNLKASQSTSILACAGQGGGAKTDGKTCEYDSTPGCPGKQDLNAGTVAQIYTGETMDSFYVNCVPRHYWGYGVCGRCVGVLYSNASFVQKQAIYITSKCN